MTLNPHTEEYYKKFIELQENLRKSEEERLKLEMKFHEMVRVTKEERQMHYRKLRAQYKKFLDEDKRRQDRNDKILQNLERIEARLAMIIAKTERFKWLRQQYRAMLDRIYKTKLDRSNCTLKEHQQPEQTQKIDRSEHFDNYLKNISTEQVKDRLGNNKITKTLSNYAKNDDLFSSVDDEEYRPNIANSLADEIVQTIDKLNKNNDRTIVGRQFEKHPEIHIGKLPIESTSSGTDGDFSDKPDDLEKSRIDDLPKVEQIQNKIDDLKIENVEQQQQQVMQNSKHNDIVGKLEQIDTLPIEEINNRQDNESAVQEPKLNDNDANCEPNEEVILEENKPKVLEISGISEIENTAEDSQHDKNITEPLLSNNNENIVNEKLQDDESCFGNKDDNKTAEFSVGDKKENIEAGECEQSLRNISKQPDVPVETDMKIDPIDQVAITGEENNDRSCPEYSSEQQYENADFSVGDKKENIEAAECGQSLHNISKQPDVPVETDMKIDPIDQVAITGEENNDRSYPEYSSEQQYENAQYDENGQLIPQFDEHGQLISQYDENGQLIPQYDQNGLLIPQFDENGQLIPQYDQNGQLIPQYDQYGQIIPQYDEHGQIIPQYDENGQLIQHYDEQYYTDPTNQQFENYPNIEQYETKQVENDEKSAEVVDEETPKIVENQEALKVEEKKESVDDGVSKQNVLEMLDTDTESVKQDTKISNDSDFDFSNS